MSTQLSERQLGQLRNALRAYHRYGRDADGAAFTWRDVREAISEITDVEIGADVRLGAERLRQFVEGVKTPAGKVRFPVPQPEALQAIVAFVTDEDVALLTEDELRESVPGPQALIRLGEYLAQDSHLERTVQPEELAGDYLHTARQADAFSRVILHVESAGGDPIFKVSETHDLYDTTSSADAEEWSMAGRRDKRASRRTSTGWGVITPEDNLLVFMKAERNGQNHTYLSLNDVGVWLRREGYPAPLFLQCHDFGVELGEFGSDFMNQWKTVIRGIRDDMRWFYKFDLSHDERITA